MKQNSEFPFRGSTKKFTFFSTNDGDFVRPKGKKVDKKRIDTDPKFDTTKRNYTEFSRVMFSVKLLRNTFRLLIKNAKSGLTGRRLTSLFFSIIKTDTTNEHGQRRISAGNVKMAERFDFNDTVKLSGRLFAKYTPTFNRSTGFLDVEVQSYIPTEALNPPSGATHYRLVMGASELDFENQRDNYREHTTERAPIDGDGTDTIHMTAQFSPNSTGVVVAVLGIEFYKQVGTTTTLLTPTALAIVYVSKP